jgi:hypothetical protein
MTTAAPSLMSIYEGWDSHQLTLVRTITPLTPEQLAWWPAPHLPSHKKRHAKINNQQQDQ